MKEPRIIINGVKISEGAAMTIRVAIETFAISLQDGLGHDDNALALTKGYQGQISHIRDLMFRSENDK